MHKHAVHCCVLFKLHVVQIGLTAQSSTARPNLPVKTRPDIWRSWEPGSESMVIQQSHCPGVPSSDDILSAVVHTHTFPHFWKKLHSAPYPQLSPLHDVPSRRNLDNLLSEASGKPLVSFSALYCLSNRRTTPPASLVRFAAEGSEPAQNPLRTWGRWLDAQHRKRPAILSSSRFCFIIGAFTLSQPRRKREFYSPKTKHIRVNFLLHHVFSSCIAFGRINWPLYPSGPDLHWNASTMNFHNLNFEYVEAPCTLRSHTVS